MPGQVIHSIERRCDVLVVGGSAAGLAAALQFGRQGVPAIVVDAGDPRNAPASIMHGYLGSEATPPSEFVDRARDEVRSYGIEVLAGRVQQVARLDSQWFRADLVGGHSVLARRIVVATGVIDELPPIDGLAPRWGKTVIHCPFCHGYEFRGRRLVQIVADVEDLHVTPLLLQLSNRLTLVVQDGATVSDADLEDVVADPQTVVRSNVDRVVDAAGGTSGVVVDLAGGDSLEADAVVVAPRFRARVECFASVGLQVTTHSSGRGTVVAVDAVGSTRVPGVFAAGNVTDPNMQMLHSAAAGSRVGASICRELAQMSLQSSIQAANEIEWEGRYSHDPVWSGHPNGALVVEASVLRPGRALDVGAGEGADAIWLAERGWKVTANEISTKALQRLRNEAARRGLSVECQHADANALTPFDTDCFDLVYLMYASVFRTADRRGVRNVLSAVAPGGVLVVVTHDPGPMRGLIDTSTESKPFDPDAYLGAEDFVAEIEESPDWDIECHALRDRPKGAASHHTHDVVVRARRRSLR